MTAASILIVEDEAIVAADLAAKLQQLGYSVAGSTDSGEKAIALARQLRPAMVLMDIRLAGGMDGLEAAAAIRRECDLPIVYLTAHSDIATLKRAMLDEPFGYILKPFEEHELQVQIEMAFHRYETDRQLRARDEQFRRANTELVQRAAELQAANDTLSASRRAALNLVEDAVAARRQAEQASADLRQQVAERRQAERRQHLATEILGILDDPLPLVGAIKSILAAIRRRMGFDAVGIRLRSGDDFPYLVQDGFGHDFVLAENSLVERALDRGICNHGHGNVRLECTCGLVISGTIDPNHPLFTSGGSFWTNDSLPLASLPVGQDPRLHPRNRCIHEGFRSVALVPIRANRQIVGLLQINDRRKDCFTLEMIQFFEGISASIGLALMRKEAEGAREAAHQRTLTILESIGDGFFSLDRQWRVIYINTRGARLIGKPGPELMGKSLWESFPQPETLPFRQAYERALAEQTSTSVEAFFPPLNMWFAAHAYPSSEGLSVFFQNITERKRNEQALHESREDLKHAQAVAHVGSWRLDVRRNELLWSDESWQIFGVPRGTPLTYETFLGMVHPDDRAYVHEKWSAGLRGEPYDIEHRIVVGDTVKWVRERAELEFDREGTLKGGFGTTEDVTDRKKADEQLRRTVEELARSNEDLVQFAYVASHDLKEPLRMVTSFTSLLKVRYQKQLDAKANEYIDFATEGASRMSRLIDDLLAYARVGRGVAVEAVEAVDATAIVDAVVKDLGASIAESGALVACDPLPTVKASALELTQLFQNLIGNAVKFRRPGVAPQVHIGVRRVSGFRCQVSGRGEVPAHGVGRPGDGEERGDTAPSGPETRNLTSETSPVWLFSVRDNGIGIDPQFAGRIFQIFQRLHTRDEYAGSGVGLAICRKIVERHGGRIWIESEPGKGTTFLFTLPG